MEPYNWKWAKHETKTTQVTTKNSEFLIEYEEARGVMTRAWELQSRYGSDRYIDVSDELDFIAYFRDDRGCRMPPDTAACVLVMSIYATDSASSGPTTVLNEGPNTTKAVYVEHIGGNESVNKYKYAPTKLDRLFYKVFKATECTKSEFSDIREDRGDLDIGWLGTEHIYKFWKEAVEKHYAVRVSVYFHLHHEINDDAASNDVSAGIIARGIAKDLGKHTASSYVALFPINKGHGHHTLARAEYDERERHVRVKYIDSMNGPKERCNIITDAFKKAIPGVTVTVDSVEVQDQEDGINCGVFVCIAMLEAADGSIPLIHERTVSESDIRKVRCIIARHDKHSQPTAIVPVDDDSEDITYLGPRGQRGQRGQRGRLNDKNDKGLRPVTISLDDYVDLTL